MTEINLTPNYEGMFKTMLKEAANQGDALSLFDCLPFDLQAQALRSIQRVIYPLTIAAQCMTNREAVEQYRETIAKILADIDRTASHKEAENDEDIPAGVRYVTRRKAMSNIFANAVVFHCPFCGSGEIEGAGAVFIEDGPYNGSEYANEGTFSRYQCQKCHNCFGLMPTPLVCRCGNYVSGEMGEDCDTDPYSDEAYICEECMKDPARLAAHAPVQARLNESATTKGDQ